MDAEPKRRQWRSACCHGTKVTAYGIRSAGQVLIPERGLFRSAIFIPDLVAGIREWGV